MYLMMYMILHYLYIFKDVLILILCTPLDVLALNSEKIVFILRKEAILG
jgi:hypothetical protein